MKNLLLTFLGLAAYVTILILVPPVIKLIGIILLIAVAASVCIAFLLFFQEREYKDAEFERQYRIMQNWLRDPEAPPDLIRGMFSEIRGLRASHSVGNQEKMFVLESEFENKYGEAV